MTATYVTIALSLWVIAVIFVLAFNRSAHRNKLEGE